MVHLCSQTYVFYYHDNIRDSKEQQWISTRCEYEILAEVECPLSRRRDLELKFSCRDNSKQESSFLSSSHFPYFFCSFLFSFRTSLSSLASLHCRSLTGARISYTRRWIAARRVLYFPPSLIISITSRFPFNVLYKYFHRKNQRIMQRKRFNYSKIDVHNYCTHRPELEIVYTFYGIWNFKKKKKRIKLQSYRHRKKFVKYYRPLLKSKNKLST